MDNGFGAKIEIVNIQLFWNNLLASLLLDNGIRKFNKIIREPKIQANTRLVLKLCRNNVFR